MSVRIENNHVIEKTGEKLHRLGDLQVLAGLSKMIFEIAAEGDYNGWYVAVPFSDGRIRYINHNLRTPDSMVLLGQGQGLMPDEEKVDLMRRLAIEANKRVHHGGCWIVGWFENSTKMVSFWKDKDGDPHAIVEMNETWNIMKTKDVDYWVEQFEEAVRTTYEKFIDPLELKPEQQVKSALGETFH